MSLSIVLGAIDKFTKPLTNMANSVKGLVKNLEMLNYPLSQKR